MGKVHPLCRVLELGVQRIDDLRQPPFLPQMEEDVLVGGDGEVGTHLQAAGERFQELVRCGSPVQVVPGVFGEKTLVLPDGNPIFAPVTAERPAGELLTGVPLALAEMQQRAGGETVAHPVQQLYRQLALGRAHGGGRPLSAIAIVERDKRGLAAHGEAHVAYLQVYIYLVAQRFNLLPLLFAIRLGDAAGIRRSAARSWRS